MSKSDNMYYFPMKFRHRPVVILFLLVLLPIVFIHGGTPDIPSQKDYANYILYVLIWLSRPIAIFLAIYSLWLNWFFLHAYYFTGHSIEEVDQILRKRQSIELKNICMARDFTVLGNIPENMRAGHVLVTNDGDEIYLTEALPIWPDIAKQLDGIPVVKQPFLRRWVI